MARLLVKRRIVLTMANRSPTEANAIAVVVAGPREVETASARVLAVNDLYDPDARFQECTGDVIVIDARQVTLRVPRCSVALLEVSLTAMRSPA